jgi:hypothetical protein
MKSILTILLIGFTCNIWSQSDSTYIHNREKAAMFSAVVPGSGQIYNEFGHRKVQGRKNISWWRAPIFLGGLAYTAYLGYINADSASIYKREWLYKDTYGESIYLFPALKGLSKNQVQDGFELHAKYRDYAIAGFALIYVLNIVDAYVDAHFVTFDVSKDLSLNLKPKYFGNAELGCSITLNFK